MKLGGLCCGGSAGASPPQEVVPLTSAEADGGHAPRGRLRKVQSSKHWKPALSAISEDGVVLDVERSNQRTVGSEKKILGKGKSAKSRSTPRYGDDYRKSTSPLALPAFSPAPYLF